MERDFRKILIAASAEMGIPLTDIHLALFETYRETLLLWNDKMNLVSLQSDLDLPVRHFIDSLTLLSCIPPGTGTVLDIGSGAGFPAIPVKIVRADLHMTLLEASRKKCSFLKEVIRKLGLKDIAVVNCRLEELVEKEKMPSFDLITSRATLKLPELLARGLPLLKPGGILAAMKGPGLEKELMALESIKNKYYRIVDTRSITLPLTGERRILLLVDNPR